MDDVSPPDARNTDRKTRVLPVVRSLEEAGPMLVEGVLARIIGPEIVLLYVQDFDNALAYLGTSYLEASSEDVDSLYALALDNLSGRDIQVHGDGAVKMVTCGGYYEAALVLRPDLWIEAVGIDDPAHAAVLIAAHDVLMVCDHRNPLALNRLWEIADEMRDEEVDHRISDQVWLLSEPLEPAPKPDIEVVNAFLDDIDPAEPVWRVWVVTGGVTLAYLLAAGPAFGELVQDNQLDSVLSWQLIAVLIGAPWAVGVLYEGIGAPGAGEVNGYRISAGAWIYAAAVFVGALLVAVFLIDAMWRTYFLTVFGAAASVYMGWLYVRAARALAARL